MNTKDIRSILTPKGEYTKTEEQSYSELSSGKIKAAISYKRAQHFMPLFDLLEDKDTSVGSECEKRVSSVENKFFTSNLKGYDSSIEEIIKASLHARLFGVSVVELFINDQGDFEFSFVPRESYYYEEDTITLKKGKTRFAPKEPKFYILRAKPVLLKVLWIAYAKHFVLSHYMKFAEFLGVPPLIGNASSSSADTIDQMSMALKNIKSGGYAVLGPTDILKVLEGRGSLSDFMGFVQYADTEIAKVINGASLGSNVAKSGSYAQSKSHEENRAEIVRSDVKLATRTAIKLFSKIGMALELNIQIEKDVDLFQRAQTLQILNNMGYNMSPENIALEFDLPAPSLKAPNIRHFSKNERDLPLDAIDANLSSAEFLKRSQEQENEILEIITNLSTQCNSYEEVYNLMQENYADLGLKKLDEVMFKAIANNLIVGAVDDGK